jgi:hypothetical protein
MTMTTSDHRVADTHRRIRNILDRCPASAWTLEESQAVLSVLAGVAGDRELDLLVFVEVAESGVPRCLGGLKR